MKKPAAGIQPKPKPARKLPASHGKIHPVVIYPFRQPGDYSDLMSLYELVARLDVEKDKYARPITIIEDRKSTRLNSSHSQISYAVFCLKKKMNCIETSP